MNRRVFTDAEGAEWEVYDVLALRGFGRPDAEPSTVSGPFRAAKSWLTFESAGERRRLSPVPEGWEDASLEVLQQYLTTATPVTARGRE